MWWCARYRGGIRKTKEIITQQETRNKKKKQYVDLLFSRVCKQEREKKNNKTFFDCVPFVYQHESFMAMLYR